MLFFIQSTEHSALSASLVCSFCFYKTMTEAKSFTKNVLPNCCNCCKSEYTNLTLIQVQVVFRHGARSPLNIHPDLPEVTFPASLMDRLKETEIPYQLVDYNTMKPLLETIRSETPIHMKGGCETGSLTTVGQKETFELGKRLYEDYHRALQLTTFSNETISTRSSNVQRTIASVCCVLAGWFGAEHIKSKGPVNIVVKESTHEDIYPNILNCPIILNIYNYVWNLIEQSQMMNSDLKKIQALMGTQSTTNFLNIHDYISTRLAHGMGCPDELLAYKKTVDKNAAKILHVLTTCCTKNFTSAKIDLTYLTMGTFMYTLITEMETAAERCMDPGSGPASPKLCLYSAHDSTLAVVSHALGIWKDKWPDFASDICLELYREKETGEFFVRTRYRGDVVMTRGEFGEYVNLDKFRSELSPFFISPEEHERRCRTVLSREEMYHSRFRSFWQKWVCCLRGGKAPKPEKPGKSFEDMSARERKLRLLAENAKGHKHNKQHDS